MISYEAGKNALAISATNVVRQLAELIGRKEKMSILLTVGRPPATFNHALLLRRRSKAEELLPYSIYS